MAMGAPIPTNTGQPHMTMTTITATHTTMPIDPGLLTLAQWLSPAFPIGGFAFSHGLETAIRDGWATDAASLQDWLADLLEDGSGRSDAIWLMLALRAPSADEVAALDAEARAFQPSSERLRETVRQGEAFARVVNDVWDTDLPSLCLPIAVGRAARLQGFDPKSTVALYLQSFVSNIVSAAVRLVPLGQTEGQRVIAALAPLCEQVASDAVSADPEDIYSNCFLSDVAAMRHETQEPRLFQS